MRAALYLLTTIAGLELLMLLALCVFHLKGNASPSMPLGFYRITHYPPAKGNLIVTKGLLKRVVATGGDTVCTDPDGTRVNGVLIPNSAPQQKDWLTNRYGCITLPTHWYWLLGDSPDSWDSRYQGAFPSSAISSTANPLWTWR